MRRALVLALVAVAVASAAAVSTGAAVHGGQRAEAKAATIASLKKTFAGLLPATTCDAGAAKRAAALKLRTGALKNLRTATPAQRKRKTAAMKKAIALLRQAKAACAAAPPGGGGTPAPPGPPAPPTPPPGTPVPFAITLHVAAGNTTRYTETSASAPAGAIHLALVNASNLSHFVSVRTAVGQQLVADSPLSPAGGPTSLDVTLPPGDYEIFCHNNGHDLLGMHIPFTVR